MNQPIVIIQRILFLTLVTALLVLPRPVFSQSLSSAEEYKIKAVFLYNFPKFIEWPENTPKSTRTICFVGRREVFETLKLIQEKSDGALQVVRHDKAGEISDCDMLFIDESSKDKVDSYLAQAGGKGILTVGETDTFLEKGGIMNFFIEENKVRFAVNIDAAENVGFRISAKLLQLAKVVK